MKRQIILGAAVVGLLGASVDAGAATNWTAGIKGGVSTANLGWEDDPPFEAGSRTGFAGGLFAQADVSKNFGVRVEGLYTMKGATATASGFDFEGALKLDYIEFPILLVGQLPASESVTLSAFGGPTLGFNTKAEWEVTFSGVTELVNADDIAGFEFGVAFGLGAAFDVDLAQSGSTDDTRWA